MDIRREDLVRNLRRAGWQRKIQEIKDFWRVFRESRASLFGLIIFSTIVVMALFAPYIAPYDPYERTGKPLEPPSWKHPLGTNDLGQDILSELIYGASVSLTIGIVSAVTAVMIGVIMGTVAGYKGGLVDEVLMRIVDLFMVMPNLLLVIFLTMVFRGTWLGTQMFLVLIIAMAITSWPTVARVVRSMILSLKERPFVESARAVGASDRYIILKYLLPSTAPLILAETLLRTASNMIIEASLSFLGLGDATKKSWGVMLHYAFSRQALVLGMWSWVIPPGLMISLSVLSLLLVGQALEVYVNPVLRR
ncbi:MAG: ABC transporter permease [Candidatus Korarchaeota archaeon]|nr:ABC transporter permease [Candidatus Korarchaeota archaeon]